MMNVIKGGVLIQKCNYVAYFPHVPILPTAPIADAMLCWSKSMCLDVGILMWLEQVKEGVLYNLTSS